MPYLPFRLYGMMVMVMLTCALAPAHAQEAVPELVTLEQDDGTEPQAPAQDSEENAAAAWQGSLMFPQGKVDDLMEVYRAYLEKMTHGQPQTEAPTRNVVSDALKLLTQDSEEIDQEIYRFSLNSILYDDADEWSIWVNGQRYNRKQALEGFMVGSSQVMVTEVTKHRITVIWMPKPRSFPPVLERWEAGKAIRKPEDNPQLAKDGWVEMDSLGQKITFALRPNQTFLSEYMTVMEGAPRLRPAVSPDALAEPPSPAAVENGGMPEAPPRSTPQGSMEVPPPAVSEPASPAPTDEEAVPSPASTPPEPFGS